MRSLDLVAHVHQIAHVTGEHSFERAGAPKLLVR